MPDGLILLRMIFKAHPSTKLTGMINADLVPIGHVSSSHQLDLTLHEMIIFTIRGTCRRGGGSMCSA